MTVGYNAAASQQSSHHQGQQMKSSDKQSTVSISRPGVSKLLMRILRGAVADGMQLPAILGTGLALASYYAQLPYHGYIIVLLVSALLLIGVVRCIRGWQQDRADYHRKLAVLRRQQRANADYTIPGFVPFTQR